MQLVLYGDLLQEIDIPERKSLFTSPAVKLEEGKSVFTPTQPYDHDQSGDKNKDENEYRYQRKFTPMLTGFIPYYSTDLCE
jgi:hypothetical protein